MIAEFIFYIVSFLIAVTGYIFVFYLTQPGDIFGWYAALVVKRFPAFLHKPLVLCEYCVTGQLSLWLYPIYFYKAHRYNVIEHTFFICLSILLVLLIKNLIVKTEK